MKQDVVQRADFRTGSSRYSRIHCPSCGEETVHHGLRCLQCGHQRPIPKGVPRGVWNNRLARRKAS